MHSSKISLRRDVDFAAPVVTGRDRSSIRLARFKVDFVNRFMRANAVPNLIEFGCGSGRTMRQLKVGSYIGVESSRAAMLHAQALAAGDATRVVYPVLPAGVGAAMALSMDVMHRLAGDGEFNAYIRTMFQAVWDYVVIYAVDQSPVWVAEAESLHGRLTEHLRRFFPGWELAAQLPVPFAAKPAVSGGAGMAARADFFVYVRHGATCVIPLMAPL